MILVFLLSLSNSVKTYASDDESDLSLLWKDRESFKLISSNDTKYELEEFIDLDQMSHQNGFLKESIRDPTIYQDILFQL